ncbi:NAD(+) synthase [Azospirillum picis]|uniref:Glutamine-dependent NAD(+) synthetase n=1 Tax=Azospirillum picis TaxID=488438 RepID=A0ABU0MKR2_9PROT|nr:NAD(+) synthase [Azospirillum picis]MBP2300102.1 NAD+ synthase [Azospirillum picis]MDQ0534056.1 NAD+ synthase [Azospirillum picis]
MTESIHAGNPAADRLSIALAQINPTAGDPAANADRIRIVRAEAAARGADLVVFPAGALPGVPALDLLRKPAFLDAVESAVRMLAAETADGGPALLVGAPWRDGGQRYNAGLLLDAGRIAAVRFQAELNGAPDDDCFDCGPMPGPVNVRGVRIGLLIAGDLASADVAETLAESGAELLVALLAESFTPGSHDRRLQAAVSRVVECALPLIAVNAAGGQDELVHDGGSLALAVGGRLAAQAPLFAEHLLLTRWLCGDGGQWECSEAETMPPVEGTEALYCALVLGLRDVVSKRRLPGVVVGLTGGPESALVAALAVDALGADRVLAVRAPLPAGSRRGDALGEELDDTAEIVGLLGCRLDNVALGPVVKAVDSLLAPAFAGRQAGVTEDRLHARVRAATLAALAERMGALLLSAADRSDLALGLADDDSGSGYAPLKDVAKSGILELARWRNIHQPPGSRGPAGRVVPDRVLARAGTGPVWRDLPPLPVLDDLLACLLGSDLSATELAARGHAAETMDEVWRLILGAEAQRRRAPPGPLVAGRDLRRDRRFPEGVGPTPPRSAPDAGDGRSTGW